jgi:hypothetical protein
VQWQLGIFDEKVCGPANSRSETIVSMRTLCSPYFTVLFYGLASTQIPSMLVKDWVFGLGGFSLLCVIFLLMIPFVITKFPYSR